MHGLTVWRCSGLLFQLRGIYPRRVQQSKRGLRMQPVIGALHPLAIETACASLRQSVRLRAHSSHAAVKTATYRSVLKHGHKRVMASRRTLLGRLHIVYDRQDSSRHPAGLASLESRHAPAQVLLYLSMYPMHASGTTFFHAADSGRAVL